MEGAYIRYEEDAPASVSVPDYPSIECGLTQIYIYIYIFIFIYIYVQKREG